MIQTIKALESNNILIRFDHEMYSHDQILKVANNLQSVFPNKKFLFISKNIDVLEITDEERVVLENICKRNSKSIEDDPGNPKNDNDGGDNNGQKDNNCN